MATVNAIDSVGKLADEAPCSLEVTTTNDGGPGSLREAIDCANTTPGLDTIGFNIPGSGVRRIQPTSPLPMITDAVIVDGYTQPGASPNTNAIDDPDPAKRGFNGTLLIELSGANAGNARGLDISASGSAIRGLVVNGFAKSGIALSGADNSVIAGNLIGTDAAGMTAVGNGGWGVIVMSGASGNVIGASGEGNADAAERNVIAGSGFGGVGITDLGTDNNVVAGNLIGTNRAGTAAIANSNRGIDVFNGAQGNRIGTNADGANDGAERNLISGNTWAGIGIYNPGTRNNTVAGNWIGVDLSGTGGLPNVLGGVSIFDGATANIIGGTTPASANAIAFNLLDGVAIVDATTINNPIVGNSIFGNGDLGIDLGTPGVTENDASDADAGANNRQNFPEITFARKSGNSLNVSYKIDSLPPTNSIYPIRVEFFLADAAGQEGQTFLGFDTYSATDFALGLRTIAFVPALPIPGKSKLVATATDSLATGGLANTSEFSPALVIPNPWHNASGPLDVRGGNSIEPDDFVDAGDALAIINYINSFGSTPVNPESDIGRPYGFLDTNNDDTVAADDALSVINAINSGQGGEGESRPMVPIGQAHQVVIQSPSDLHDLITLLATETANHSRRRK